MAEEMTSMRSDRYVDRSVLEFQLANRSPIAGYEDEETVSLEEAVKKIIPFVGDVSKYVQDAKQKCNQNSALITWDESAAIYLYTMSIPLFSRLNETLRTENRHALKPWFAFLKLFLSALDKLPSSTVTVWRAVAGDIGSSIIINKENTWWSINSSSTALNVVEWFLGDYGTLFTINAIYGKKIHEYSAFPDEKEVILMPGTHLLTTSEPLFFKNSLRIIHLQGREFNWTNYTIVSISE